MARITLTMLLQACSYSIAMNWSKLRIKALYCAILAFDLFLLAIFLATQPANDSTYIPKSQRWNWKRMTTIWRRIRLKIAQKIRSFKAEREKRTQLQDMWRAAREIAGESRSTWRENFMISTATAVMAMAAIAMQTQTDTKYDNRVYFDTDSVTVGVDNRCTGCISHIAEDFVGPLEDSNRSIKGFGGVRTANVKIGTLNWSW